MPFLNKKKLLLGLAFFSLLIVSIPLTISLFNKPQETRSRASGSTTLSFNPTSSAGSPIQKNVGDDVSIDLMVNPGSNLVTFLRLQITFDSTKLQLASNPFVVNSIAFPVVVEGPITTAPGTILESLSVGSDFTKAIQTTVKVGTLNFKAIGNTGGTPTVVSFGNLSQALSAGPNDQASENVLSTTIPANITIGGQGTGTISGTITPHPTGTSTILSFKILLHGVGSGGDNANDDSELSNKNPLHPQRNLAVQVFDQNNQLVSSSSSSIVYQEQGGTFLGTVDLGPGFTTGNYNLKVKTDGYLRRLIPGIQRITNLEENTIPDTDLVAADVNNDNTLNALDYNALLDCGYGALNPLPMEDASSLFVTQACQAHQPPRLIDTDDNGIINSPDFNLFLRELSVQKGD